jgi:1,2-diacylglycerol 3-beta-glucosyltransferase
MGRSVIALVDPFAGLPTWAQLFFYFVCALIVGVLAWTGILFASSRRWSRTAPGPDPAAADSFLWVFLVPALNEEVTIGDSVERLLAVEATNKAIVVIDDGSSDGTAEVLALRTEPEIAVLTRRPPEARTGKATALNAAWRHLDSVLTTGRWADWPRERVIVVVVDADGRLDPGAPAHVAPHFADPRVGGLQVLVRIYNRHNPLTWLQDIEFSVYGLLYQAGRASWGTAGMGGNGQFNRLAALDSIATDDTGGPWRNRLTEDQDLGLRLLENGWRSVSESRTSVDQQGVSSLRRLLRQRTRWAQGNLQAIAHLGAAMRADLPWLVRADLIAYLLQPVIQALVGVAFAVSIFLFIFDHTAFWGTTAWIELAFFFVLGFGGVALGLVARGARKGAASIAFNLLIIPAYAAYSWTIWPVLTRATARQVTRRTGWAKTTREPIGDSK